MRRITKTPAAASRPGTPALGLIYGIDRATVLNGVWLEEIEDCPAEEGATITWEDSSALSLGEERLFYLFRPLQQ
ncbi:MAG: hypothetical protein ACR2RV_03205 [Verrucomicrobiales bacterium]